MKKLVVLIAGLMLVSLGVNAQNPQSAQAQASATIIAPLQITKNVDLNFGNVAAGSSAGTVVLSPAGVRTPNNVILPSVTGTVSAAQFTVVGLPNATYAITLPSSNVTITSGSNSMIVNNFTHNANPVQLDNNGQQIFNVGATLNVGAGQAAGTYTGQFQVTVDYN